ncbi:MAG: hypothetical protein LBD59_08815 [Prevotellaceae bacterium]|nr:hypothetical protein [Prevotellaceae bacterium]
MGEKVSEKKRKTLCALRKKKLAGKVLKIQGNIVFFQRRQVKIFERFLKNCLELKKTHYLCRKFFSPEMSLKRLLKAF